MFTKYILSYLFEPGVYYETYLPTYMYKLQIEIYALGKLSGI